jgi:hypothetical protein
MRSVEGFDALIIGGALYANRWPWKARRFVNRNVSALRALPVWMFSSGPLDESADEKAILPTRDVSILAERIGAQGHVTFGGRLEPTAKGFPASAMAKTHGGDWRNVERIRAWAAGIATSLPTALPGPIVEQPAHSLVAWLWRPVVGWTLCAALMRLLLDTAPFGAAVAIHAAAAPFIFATMAWGYFRHRGAREPLTTAVAWTLIVIALDAVVVAGTVMRSFAMFASIAATWLPFALVLFAVWGTGAAVAMMPLAEALAERTGTPTPSR